MSSFIRAGSTYTIAIVVGAAVIIAFWLLLQIAMWVCTIVAALAGFWMIIFWCSWHSWGDPVIWTAFATTTRLFAYYGIAAILLRALPPLALRWLER